MSAKRRIDLVKYFLLDSPAAQSRALHNILSPQNAKTLVANLPTDKEYSTYFLNRLQSLPPVFISQNDHSLLQQLFFNSPANFQAQGDELSYEAEQLCCAIEIVSSQKKEGVTVYQELEQVLALATPQTIREIKKQLEEVFKYLLGRRDEAEELQLEANFQLSDAIIQTVTRASGEGLLEPDWKELEAMEKLLRAKSYHKKGLKQKALNNFKQICTDSTASSNTRLEALRVLCVDSEEGGDTSLLESLMNEMQSRGEKRYEEYIRENITRIKAVGGGRSDELV